MLKFKSLRELLELLLEPLEPFTMPIIELKQKLGKKTFLSKSRKKLKNREKNDFFAKKKTDLRVDCCRERER